MSKLIRLPDGHYIRTESILSVGEPWESNDEQFYTIYYIRGEGDRDFYKVTLSPTFFKTKERAQEAVDKFVDRLNNLL